MPTKTRRTTKVQTDALLTEKLEHHSHCQYPACTAPATHVDYIVTPADGGNHDWHNLQSHCNAHTSA